MKCGFEAVPLPVVVADHARVGDDGVRHDRRELFRDLVSEAPRGVPLAAVPLEPVDVQHDPRSPRDPRQKARERVDGVADEDRVEALERGVHAGDKAVHDSVEVLRRDRREDADLRAAPLAETRLGVARARVNGDVVTAGGEPGRQLFGERLEPAIPGGDAARAEDAEFHSY